MTLCSRISSSSSSCGAASTDISDLLSPLLPIVHRLRQVFRATFRILCFMYVRAGRTPTYHHRWRKKCFFMIMFNTKGKGTDKDESLRPTQKEEIHKRKVILRSDHHGIIHFQFLNQNQKLDADLKFQWLQHVLSVSGNC